MRSMWKGAISFGLVTIPVKLYTATEQRDVSFRQVHVKDGGRIHFRRVCSIDGEEVPYADVAKGFELPDGEMVVLTEEDLEVLELPRHALHAAELELDLEHGAHDLRAVHGDQRRDHGDMGDDVGQVLHGRSFQRVLRACSSWRHHAW